MPLELERKEEVNVVRVTTETFHKLGDVCAEWLRETKSVFPVEIPQASVDLQDATREANGTLFALSVAGRYVGFIRGQIQRYSMCGIDVAAEIGWYVCLEYRSHGWKLLLALEDWARDMGVKAVTTHIMTSAGSDGGARAMGAMAKMQYKELERSFYKIIS